jgi:dTDP-4-dehydrorhamnose 3,5-epimerase
MEILEIKEFPIPEIKIIRFARFADHRGYFTESYRKSELASNPKTSFLKDSQFVQSSESFSRAGTVRGLHFQWDPYMGKLVRTVHGRMIDLILDIRIGAPNYGRIIAIDMPASRERGFDEWVWVPPGFAHGNIFPDETAIEYLCSGEHNPSCEAGISPLADDIDWTICDLRLRREATRLLFNNPLITDKDRHALSVSGWKNDARSKRFMYASPEATSNGTK